ncbi:hypothetical protein TREMEDRAFT_72886 [Tremella mesenterica DSM 1558]|uniref:uncharacterized protein n=1 Tax=Tremella mesenterica (strain ATCC 24925 / CBS 8224 / DSM 1558 / NBRC 9311 / NRRL Y-6157 / RJB 2259-6 / UBC 559-6) TaxID=578456 RepID=UPI0003F49827|nr:uncharacterized protein TREMEDRAFT_72886 [Tremella mesenterica DSM 1558]EIW72809.1 hypothetical protein TREMEDRAFT_72886 [Tremella mesenterica DSM 1558]
MARDTKDSRGSFTPRGRGRGGFQDRGGRGRGGNRGGPARGGSSAGGKKVDYTNVPFDYTTVNRQSYSKLDGFSVTPNNTDSPQPGPSNGGNNRSRAFPPRSRRRRLQPGIPHRTGVSGSATPATGTGLGFHGSPRVPSRSDGQTYGGGSAPLFIRAGELFKQGEADIITKDKNGVHVQAMDMSDPSAPQMNHLQDDTEVDIYDPAIFATIPSQVSISPLSPPKPLVEEEVEDDDEPIRGRFDFTQEQEPSSPHIDEADESDVLFYVDTAPSIEVEAGPSYTTISAPPLGTASDSESEEKIVYVPKVSRHEVSDTVQMSHPRPSEVPVSGSKPATTPVTMKKMDVSSSSQAPHTLLEVSGLAMKGKRRDRGRRAGRKLQQRRRRDVGSDIDWGSDDSSSRLILGKTEEDEQEDQRDMEVLRDYLEGTSLNARVEDEDEEEGEGAGEEEEEEESESVLRAGTPSDMRNRSVSPVSQTSDDIIGREGLVVEADGAEVEGQDLEDEQSDTGSESSSELGILKAAMDDFDEMRITTLDSSSDSDEDDGGWGLMNEDWFIRNMQSALDDPVSSKDRKAPQKLFSSIETGDFGDDWPTAPVKKNKKGKHLPAELQAQWEKDRQKKALKREERALARLMAQFDPHPTSRKRKGKSKAHQASIAHLIPASAAEVADMFDISDDEVGTGGNGREGMMPPTMDLLDSDIRAFLRDEGKTTYSLPPMDKEGRMKVHMIAECFGLKSKSRGSGKSRFTVLIKTSYSGNNIDEHRLARVLQASSHSNGSFYKAFYSKGKTSSGKKTKGHKDVGSSVRHREGDLVGEGAEKIGMDNIGHRLLSKMGWAEGDRIGRTADGLEAPIVAIVKNTKSGLGAYSGMR